MKKISLFVLPLFLFACEPVQVVNLDNQEEVADMQNVMGLEYRDWEKTADKMVKSMIDSGRLDKKDGKEYILAVGRITNDTMQRIDTDLLVKKIRTQLTNSGKVMVTTAAPVNIQKQAFNVPAMESGSYKSKTNSFYGSEEVSANYATMKNQKIIVEKKVGEDTMTNDVRDLRYNDEYDQSTIPGKGTLIAPDLSLTGKIIQRNIKETRKERVEYYFQLTLTNIKNGLVLWENEEPIIKRGSEAPTW